MVQAVEMTDDKPGGAQGLPPFERDGKLIHENIDTIFHCGCVGSDCYGFILVIKMVGE